MSVPSDNPSEQREQFEFKFVLSGPFGVGKTTFIENISSVDVVGTEVETTGEEALQKDSTTVGLEYGQYDVETSDFDIRLLLYGTPGQRRFEFMWEVITEGADACIVLVDASRPDTWKDAADIISYFSALPVAAFAVGANRTRHHPKALERLTDYLAIDAPVIPCEATDPASARNLLVEVLGQMVGDDEEVLADA